MIKKERFTFWIPAFDLVSKVNACVEKVLDRNIHDVLIQSPQLKEGEMSFLLFWVRLRFGLKQSTRDLHIRTPVILKKEEKVHMVPKSHCKRIMQVFSCQISKGLLLIALAFYWRLQSFDSINLKG
jgi:hypothetical protein